MRIFTDQLNSHISRQAEKLGAPIHWWPSEDGGVNRAKQKFVERVYAEKFRDQGNHLFCIITDKEPVMTFAARGFVSKRGRKYQSLYKCRKPVKQYYIFTVVSDPDALNQTAKGIDGSGLQFEPGFILRTM